MIKTGVNFSGLIGPELIRLLINHPDIDLRWVAGANMPAEGIAAVFDHLQGEVGKIPTRPDFDTIDLYIGNDFQELESFMSSNDKAKAILLGPLLKLTGYDDAVLGVCEYNRKPMVRGGRLAIQPDMYTYLMAIALMPLAKHLMLNSLIQGTILMPSPTALPGIRVPATTLSPLTFKKLRTDILQKLQTSFESPIEVNVIETNNSHFACCILTVDTKMNLQDVRKMYDEFYSDHRHIVFPSHPVNEVMVSGTNKTVIGLGNDGLGRLVITVGIDVRFKQAGNIIHMLNLLFGLDELTGF